MKMFDAIRCRRTPRGKLPGTAGAPDACEAPQSGQSAKDQTEGAAEKTCHPPARVWNGWQPFGVFPRNQDE